MAKTLKEPMIVTGTTANGDKKVYSSTVNEQGEVKNETIANMYKVGENVAFDNYAVTDAKDRSVGVMSVDKQESQHMNFSADKDVQSAVTEKRESVIGRKTSAIEEVMAAAERLDELESGQTASYSK